MEYSAKWPEASPPLCLALNNKRIGGLLADSDFLYFWRLDRFRAQLRPPPDRLHIPPATGRRLPCLWFNNGGNRQHFYLLDGRGRLLRWNEDDSIAPSRRGNAPIWPDPISEKVIALARAGEQHIVYVHHDGTRPQLVLHERGARTSGDRVSYFPGSAPWPQPPTQAVIKGRLIRRYGTIQWRGAWAVPTDARGETWGLLTVDNTQGRGDEPAIVHLGAGWDVFGLCAMPERPNPALVARSPDRRKLFAVDAAHREVLYAGDVPIATVAIHPEHELIVMIDENRRLIALRPDDPESIGVWHANGASAR